MFETQIAAGMALLDERHPGWEYKINLDRLDLTTAAYDGGQRDGDCGCVCAQLDYAIDVSRNGLYGHGQYSRMIERLGLAEGSTYGPGYSPRGHGTAETAGEYAFWLPQPPPGVTYSNLSAAAEWNTLTEEWKDAIQLRIDNQEDDS